MNNSKTKKTVEQQNEEFYKIKEEKLDTPTFPEIVYTKLPKLLREGCQLFTSPREKDIFLISSLTLMSGSFPKYFGIYDNRKVFFNFYSFVAAPPASGKGVLIHAYQYVELIHITLRNQFMEEFKTWQISKKNSEKEAEKKPSPIDQIAQPIYKMQEPI